MLEVWKGISINFSTSKFFMIFTINTDNDRINYKNFKNTWEKIKEKRRILEKPTEISTKNNSKKPNCSRYSYKIYIWLFFV